MKRKQPGYFNNAGYQFYGNNSESAPASEPEPEPEPEPIYAALHWTGQNTYTTTNNGISTNNRIFTIPEDGDYFLTQRFIFQGSLQNIWVIIKINGVNNTLWNTHTNRSSANRKADQIFSLLATNTIEVLTSGTLQAGSYNILYKLD